MTEYKLTNKTTEERLNKFAMNADLECVTATRTTWWSLYLPEYMPYTSSGLPCDPRGCMLFQGNFAEYWNKVKVDASHFGKHGLRAFIAAFHGNIEVFTEDRGWRPTSLTTWDEVNALIDKEDAKGD